MNAEQPDLEWLNWLLNFAINGCGVFPSAKQNAKDHLRRTGDPESAIDSVIRSNTSYATATGFATGLGGVATIPLIPVGVTASLGLGLYTIACVAELRGYDTEAKDQDEYAQVKTLMLIALLGDGGKELVKKAGIQAGKGVLYGVLKQVPNKALIEINKQVGFRLIAKYGAGRGVVTVMKMVPLAGGVVGGTLDGTFVYTCGQCAKTHFPYYS
jgi:hypothetical protein